MRSGTSTLESGGPSWPPLPRRVLGTRKCGDGDWHRDGARDPSHPIWLISGGGGRDADDVVVDLSRGFDRRNDATIVRLLLINAVGRGLKAKRGAASAKSASELVRLYRWLVRWREGMGITSNRDLQRDHLLVYAEMLPGGVLEMAQIYEQFEELSARIKSAGGKLPVRTDSYGRLIPDWHLLSVEHGIGSHALFKNAAFRALLASSAAFPDGTYFGTRAETQAALRRRRLPPREPTPAARNVKSERTIAGQLEIWDYLWIISHRKPQPPDRLAFKPFAKGELKTLAMELGRPRQSTAVLDPRDFYRLLNKAAFWALDCSEVILEALHIRATCPGFRSSNTLSATIRRQSRELDAKCPPGMPKLLLSWRDETPGMLRHMVAMPDREASGFSSGSRINLTQAVQCLFVAAHLLIGGFAARRSGETNDLRVGCLQERQPGVIELSIYIEKTLRDYDSIPVPPMVRAVVDVLERLTAETRSTTGGDRLFDFLRGTLLPGKGRVGFAFGSAMRMFAAVNDLAPPHGRLDWTLREHELRKGFATTYFYGYDAADLPSLRRFLRHYDSRMTLIYIRDVLPGRIMRLSAEIAARQELEREGLAAHEPELIEKSQALLASLKEQQRVFNEVRCEAAATVVLEIFMGKTKIFGRGAGLVHATVAELRQRVEGTIRIAGRLNAPPGLNLIKLAKQVTWRLWVRPVPGSSLACLCEPGNQEHLAVAKCEERRRIAGRAHFSGEPEDNQYEDIDMAFTDQASCLQCVHSAASGDAVDAVAATNELLRHAAMRAGTRSLAQGAAEIAEQHRVASADLIREAAGVQ